MKLGRAPTTCKTCIGIPSILSCASRVESQVVDWGFNQIQGQSVARMSRLVVGQFPGELLERRSIHLCRLNDSSRKVSVFPSVLVNDERTIRPLA